VSAALRRRAAGRNGCGDPRRDGGPYHGGQVQRRPARRGAWPDAGPARRLLVATDALAAPSRCCQGYRATPFGSISSGSVNQPCQSDKNNHPSCQQDEGVQRQPSDSRPLCNLAQVVTLEE
jgi:hypothetical protein